MVAIFKENQLGSASIFQLLKTRVKPGESVVIAVYVIVVWEAGYTTDNTLNLSISLYIGIVFSFLFVICMLLFFCLFFWLRSYNKTGVGCDNCTWPPSLTENFINLPQTPVLRIEYCSPVKHYENVD